MEHPPASEPVGDQNPERAAPWTPLARGIASFAVLTYMAAVIVPPLAGPPPASDLARALIQPLRPLVGLLHLGHGYRFFAPIPDPATRSAGGSSVPMARRSPERSPTASETGPACSTTAGS